MNKVLKSAVFAVSALMSTMSLQAADQVVKASDAKSSEKFSCLHCATGCKCAESFLHHLRNPNGIMGAHLHKQGEWMFTLKYMHMEMDGLQQGRESVSRRSKQGMGAGRYMTLPREMKMDMRMLSVMYGLNDDLTLSAMVPHLRKSMDSNRFQMGMMGNPNVFTDFNTVSEGLGDIKLALNARMIQGESWELILNAGVTLPTGDIGQRETTPMATGMLLPYPMQLGAGSWQTTVGATAIFYEENFSYGLQALLTTPIGKNHHGYRLGESAEINGWLNYQLAEKTAFTLRSSWKWQNDIRGLDKEIDMMKAMNPAADAHGQQRWALSVHPGFRHFISDNIMVFGELDLPVAEEVSGLGLKTSWGASAGISFFF